MKQPVTFTIKPGELPVFYTYFALGVLHAIKSRSVSPDVGIWTLARPVIQRFISEHSDAPIELLEILQACDEPSLAAKLSDGSLLDSCLAGLITRLEALAKTYPEPNILPSFHWLSGSPQDT